MKDDEWPVLCSTRPEFRPLSEEEVLNAIENDADCAGPVMREVLRLGAEFLIGFKLFADQHGLASRGLDFPVTCPIEKIAIEGIVRFIMAHRSEFSKVKVTTATISDN